MTYFELVGPDRVPETIFRQFRDDAWYNRFRVVFHISSEPVIVCSLSSQSDPGVETEALEIVERFGGLDFQVWIGQH